MSAVKVIATPSPEGKRRAFILSEDRIGHYSEFRAFFVSTFDLDGSDCASQVTWLPRRVLNTP
jgi:hypothetical protein